MAEWTKWMPFNSQQVAVFAPPRKGVYALLEKSEIVYYGMSEKNIKARLMSHLSGAESPATQRADHFCWKECADPVAAEQAALNAHKYQNGGQLPKYNTVG